MSASSPKERRHSCRRIEFHESGDKNVAAPCLDLSVRIHGHRAGSPTGPAPGAWTAADLIACWQNGARVFELRPEQIGAIALLPDSVFDLNVGPNPPAHHRHFHCATVFTFHAGPAERIARVCRELDLPVSLKLSPTLLDPDELRALLPSPDYEILPGELTFAEAVDLVHSLPGATVKFCNVLELIHRPTGTTVYLTGTPLHHIALRLVERWRQVSNAPIGFTAGVNAGNFADCVARGFAPVTAATDLLKHGPTQFQLYLQNLGQRMRAVGAQTIAEFVTKTTPATPLPATALTTRRIGSHLWLADW